MSRPETRRLKVTGCKFVASGVSGDGKPWSKYEIEAEDDQGRTVLHRLRSWVPLQAIDRVQSFSVRKSDHNGFVEFWLSSPGSVDRLSELEARVQALEARLGRAA